MHRAHFNSPKRAVLQEDDIGKACVGDRMAIQGLQAMLAPFMKCCPCM